MMRFSTLFFLSLGSAAAGFTFTGLPGTVLIDTDVSATLLRETTDSTEFSLELTAEDGIVFQVIQVFQGEEATSIPFNFTPTVAGLYNLELITNDNSTEIFGFSPIVNVTTALPLSSSSLPSSSLPSSSLTTSIATFSSSAGPSTVTVTSPPSPSNSTTQSASNSAARMPQKLDIGAIVGGAVGGSIVLIAGLVFIVLCHRRRRRK
ncbi:hypothetical protein BT96DRAFT_649806 [Gymnopus androsaceus JB14]|uniref:Mid2 domain-containing protein n=1 Tax=Gymnopus androsaceus JB14 TaxID=1447944 RepID=A0A6A4HQJ3_9AGAR|nr:hypothetical protein BT96DRAFT_649806 [Gymnopus androsaceus JB14]